ncbi:dolichol-phosphate mannosyltransferase [Steroidobacter denitrificans]|uniref:Dolichol-phosphate mannosyltransferase n=1 Tax=Steroidobacter denitrificans TaxID=465721 RepID=A0A127F7P8_STEDE|nr:glycosyltransferase family 2 protein [Steroidobacter denitrificans]AMN46472.1 dolichol-phosphate mannosyltransferase [Steroidobacter denitrificans]
MNVALSVVIPVFNEAENIRPLLAEIVAALETVWHFEIVCVDDHSQDGTLEVLRAAQAELGLLRILHHAARAGQSAAIRNGVKAAHGAWIATLDGDGQNDPVDIPKLLKIRDAADPAIKLFAGWRIDRQDGTSKRWGSRWANRIRTGILHDDTPDTGCGIKLFERDAFLDLPYFDHMHRYLPALMQRAGWKTISVPVSHRRRIAGESKYNNITRAVAGISDLRGVAWLIRRSNPVDVREIP